MTDTTAAEPVKIYPCPLPDCPWTTISEPAGPAEHPGALAEHFGYGVFAARATAERLARKERELADHLALHTPQEFGIALATANKRIAELEQLAAKAAEPTFVPLSYTELARRILELEAANEHLRERLKHAAIVIRSTCACTSCKDFAASVLDTVDA